MRDSQIFSHVQSAGGALGGLASAIDMIPRLQEKKKRIDVHTNMATAILNHVKVRSLPEREKSHVLLLLIYSLIVFYLCTLD